MCKRLLKVLILVVLGVFAVIPTQTTFAKTSEDYTNHWAEAQIIQAIEAGFVSGYPDGTFRPDNSITRAEFMRIINKSFDFVKKSKKTYSDVKATDWYVDEVAKAVEAKYMTGYEDGTMGPNANIKRGEVAVVFTKILDLYKNKEAADKFSDVIPDWSKDSIGAVVDAGYMSGYPDGTFGSEKAITRAEAVSTLIKVLYGDEGIEGNIEFNFPNQGEKPTNMYLKMKSANDENRYETIQEGNLYNDDPIHPINNSYIFDHLYIYEAVERETEIYYTIVSNQAFYTGTFTVGEFIDGKEIKLVANNDPKGNIEIDIPAIDDTMDDMSFLAVKAGDGSSSPWSTRLEATNKTKIPVGAYTFYFTAQNEGNFYLVAENIEVKAGLNRLVISEETLMTHPLSFEEFPDWRVNDISVSAYTAFSEEDDDWGSDMGYADGSFPLFKNGDKLHLTDGFENISLNFTLVNPKNTRKSWGAMVNIPVESLKAGEAIKVASKFEFNIENELIDGVLVLDPNQPIWQQLHITMKNEWKQELSYISNYSNYDFDSYDGDLTFKDESGKTVSLGLESLYTSEESTIQDIFPNAKGKIEMKISNKQEKMPFTITDKTIILKLEKLEK